MLSELVERTTICGLRDLAAEARRPYTHVLSMLDPERIDLDAPQSWPLAQTLVIRCHDEIDPRPNSQLPTRAQMEQILSFGAAALGSGRRPGGGLLVHCHSGISRSTAAAVAIWAHARPQCRASDILSSLRLARPIAWPNSLMVAFADELLGRDGRLVAALQEFFRQRLAAEPGLAEQMRRLRRSRDVDCALGDAVPTPP